MILFVGSGCCALIYEIIWYQLLQLLLGLTTISLGVLLGTFMGGMCLGSYLLPRLISNRLHPLRVYALLELGIGLIGIAVLHAMPAIARLYLAHSNAQGGAGEMLLRAGIAALCLLPPTILMGATLPAVARWIETTPQGVSWLGFFYGGNIAGAVFGCLLAGFYLLRHFDVATGTYLAATLNVTVSVVGLLLAARAPYTPPAPKPRQERAASAPGAGAVYVTIALSGLTALGAEVVWTRLLSLYFGVTVYTFSIILAVFLVGLGLGSTAGSALARSLARPRLALAWCQFLLTAAIAWTAAMIALSLPNWPINPALATNPWYTFQMDLACCAWVILPATLLWGASFPLALAAVAAPGQDPGRMVGGVYAANTIGAILGALGFSMLVVPRIGTQGAQQLMIGLSALSALVLILSSPQAAASEDPSLDPAPRGGVASGLAGAFAITAVIVLATFLIWGVAKTPWGLIAYGRYVATYGKNLQPNLVEEKDIPTGGVAEDIYCTYQGEGIDGSVAVTMTGGGVRNFHAAGKIQASSDPRDMRLQRMLGHISALVHPHPKTVLVVACGAGVTAGTFLLYPDIEKIVVCEIEPLVHDQVAPRFKNENYNLVNDKRVTFVFDDGRHYLQTTKDKFDIITSDPIDPWVKGCAALNTVEYFKMAKDHLNPGGVVSQWLPLYESNAPAVKSVIGTFFQVFQGGTIWSNDDSGSGYDTVLVGQDGPTQIDVAGLEARLDSPSYEKVKTSLADVGFKSAVDLLATYAGQAPALKEWLKDAQINNDRDLRLQYLAGMGANSYQETEILSQITKYYAFPDNILLAPAAMKEPLSRKMKR